MNPPPRHRVALLGASGVLLLLALLLADWNWARPAVVRYLEHTSKREIQADDLQIRLDADWQPVVRLRNLRVANAPWASGDRPFITAREASFTFDWASLFSDVRVMRKMHLVEADIDLQRRPDGVRNWRLTRPDDRGRGRLRIHRLQAERSRLTLIHGGIGLTLEARSTPLSQPREGYAQQVDFRGRYGGADWAGQAETGAVLSMVDTAERFALRGQARSGGTTLALQGQVANLLQLTVVEAQVQVRGETLSQLQPFLQRVPWPDSRPYRFEGRLVREGSTWAAHDARLSLGRSDLRGEARYTPARTQRDRRAVLHAQVKSERLRLEDLPSRNGIGAAAAASAPSATHVLPQRELPLDALRALDGRITLQAEQLEAPSWPAARDLHAVATLEGGTVRVQLQRGELGGGRWQGRFSIDTHAREPEATLQLQARGVKLPQLWPALTRQPGVRWPAVDGELKLSALGPTLASWWRGVDGQLDLRFTGGSLPKKLDARLGLHAGRMLGSLIGGDQPVPIRCGAVSLAFKGGVGRTQLLVLETERTQVQGSGSVRLADERWDLVLTPEAHGGVLPASIVAEGSFRGLKVELAQREQVPASHARCA
ncbi:AsmA family protein [Piscinibacter sp. HJYY11]|uniref:AsmA family protein n=1 Tax=Piscinibacter sp. HJYY11 TaxID=2801333 RepID=UPI00191DEDAC|nr:AsmA family protein [Piscinibacter sp. HJYY11]MBL0729126.1 AsmA family protein [Piscinibacter sp. HJYY11]